MKTNYRLMQVKSIAECSKGSILQYFRPSLTYHLSFNNKIFVLSILSDRLRQVWLYTQASKHAQLGLQNELIDMTYNTFEIITWSCIYLFSTKRVKIGVAFLLSMSIFQRLKLWVPSYDESTT